jgi:hypothetical protein
MRGIAFERLSSTALFAATVFPPQKAQISKGGIWIRGHDYEFARQDVRLNHYDENPRLRLMISFMISLVPAKMERALTSRERRQMRYSSM